MTTLRRLGTAAGAVVVAAGVLGWAAYGLGLFIGLVILGVRTMVGP